MALNGGFDKRGGWNEKSVYGNENNFDVGGKRLT
jgi:hypothetical protein